MQPNPYRFVKIFVFFGLLLAVMLAACTPPASPVPAAPAGAAAVPIPEVAVEASDFRVDDAGPCAGRGLVAVTVNNSGEASHAPFFAPS